MKENESQILIIHDQIFMDFNAVINEKNYGIKFIPFKHLIIVFKGKKYFAFSCCS